MDTRALDVIVVVGACACWALLGYSWGIRRRRTRLTVTVPGHPTVTVALAPAPPSADLAAAMTAACRDIADQLKEDNR